MIETPRLVESPAQATAMIPLLIPRSAIATEIGPAIREVFAVLGAQGLRPAGPWFCYHRRLDPERFDFEVSVPIEETITGSGRVCAGLRPAARIARTVMRGGYEQLPAAWPALDRWITGQGLKTRGDFWETYAVGPEHSADPADWRTELNRVLIAD